MKKQWLKITAVIFVAFILIYVPCFAFKSARDYEIYKEPQLNTRIYSVYHIETFEGGGKSRANFLNSLARSLEKENPGNLFIIKTINPDDLESILSKQLPDIISFGHGIGKIVLPYLKTISNTCSIRDEMLNSGMFNNKIYAYPYIASGYAYFTHGVKNNEYIVGKSNYISPEKSYETDQKSIQVESSYEAYKEFIYNKNSNLLGTARDVFRVENLNKIGRLNASIKPFDSYTDLIQYIGITNHDILSEKFVEMCLSTEYQNKLTEYSLFSVLNHKLYSFGIYNDMENAILNCKVARVFE